ncbi:MAG: endo-1,4-beta-xylanase Z [Muribaculaceae bacterium]|nr:endo-1,4-beta-xylanase Z [Muribaculaceae bacterium]
MVKILERHKAQHHFGNRPDNGTVEHCSMSSDILGTNKDFSIYLPAEYENSEDRYPVLYLFHPGGGTHETWISLGQLPQILDDAIRSGLIRPMIVVLPDGSGEGDFHLGRHMGFFSVPGWDYEAYFHKELIPLIDSSYRTIPEKSARAVTGVSMGGEAAISYAQKYSGYYASACAISGLLGHPEKSQLSDSDKDYYTSLVSNNPSLFVENASADEVDRLKSVRWYVDCADNDYVYEGNIQFFMAMKSKNIPLDYRMRSGVHGWYYWITGFAPLIQFISSGFQLHT